MMSDIVAIVLTGGINKHLDILAREKSTSGLKIGGHLKLVDFVISNCVDSGIGAINIITDNHSRHLWPYLRHWHTRGRGEFEVKICDSGSNDCDGTADCLFRHAGLIENQYQDSILVLSSDKIYRMDYNLLLQRHQETNADITIGVVPVPLEENHEKVTIAMDKQGHVSLRDLERISGSSSFALVPMGAYLIKKKILLEYLAADNASTSSPHSLKKTLLPKMIRETDTFAVPFTSYWRDIKTLNDYYLANMEYLAQKPGMNNQINTPARNPFSLRTLSAPYTTGNIRSSIVGEGCEIEGYVENSILCPGVIVKRHAEIWDSIILGEGTVEKYSVIDHSIIGSHVNIGDQCYVGLGAVAVNGHSNITVIGDNVCIPSYTSIGRDCRIMPGTGREEFSSGVVAPGTILDRKHAMINAAILQ